MSENVLKPGETIRPPVSESMVPELVQRIFGLKVLTVKEMKSYDDRNFYIKVHSDSTNPYIPTVSTDGYVLKILNFLDSKNEDMVQGQNDIMLHLTQKGFLVSKPMKTIHGKTLTNEKLLLDAEQSDKKCILRLMNFIPLKILFEVIYTKQLMFEAGEFASRMQQALKDFNNKLLKARESIWRIEATSQLTKFLYAIQNEEKSQTFKEFLDIWNSKIVPIIPSLEKGFIHGDVNEQNLLVGKDEENSSYHISGIIDFGDASHSCYVFELASVITYMMIETKEIDPLDAGGYVIAGYIKHRKLPQQEWEILKECVSARFCQSLVLGAYSYLNDPGNEYLLTTAEKGWKAFKIFWETPKEVIFERWTKILNEKNI